MRLSYQWLKEFVEFDLTLDEACHRLTMVGLEIEGVEQVGTDHALEVNVTPNRADCLSVLGIAREMAAITAKPLVMPKVALKETADTTFKLEILDPALCRRYAGRVIRGVTIADSPQWMKDRLELSGIRSINNIVDITNYVLLELGHPLHAFDLHTLADATIRVGVAGPERTIKTLDGSDRPLPADALLIWDGKRPVAVAGVMGGAETEVSSSTKDVFLESAHFKPESIRRTSKALGLKTEAAYRFERGTDIEMLAVALDRAAYLMQELAGGKVERTVDAYPAPYKASTISTTFSFINKYLGAEIPKDEVVALLERLQFSPTHTDQSVTITIPPHRTDMFIEADIVEEVARLRGYGSIPTVLPKFEITPSPKVPRRRLVESLGHALRQRGFHEAINYSFMDITHLDLLSIAQDDPRRRAVPIKNPLRSEDGHMRTALTPSLLTNFVYNFSRGIKDVRLYEAAVVFERTDAQLPTERWRIGALSFMEPMPMLYPDATEGFYKIKGDVEALLELLKLQSAATFSPTEEPFMHPGKAADIFVNGTRVGYVGAVSPAVIEKLDIKTKALPYVFELDIEALLALSTAKITYAPIPKYPPVERDISLLAPAALTAEQVTKSLKSYPSEIIEEVGVFDAYQGKNIPQGMRSLAFRVRYRSIEKTLTDDEVDAVHAALVEHVSKSTGAQVRGA